MSEKHDPLEEWRAEHNKNIFCVICGRTEYEADHSWCRHRVARQQQLAEMVGGKIDGAKFVEAATTGLRKRTRTPQPPKRRNKE